MVLAQESQRDEQNRAEFRNRSKKNNRNWYMTEMAKN